MTTKSQLVQWLQTCAASGMLSQPQVATRTGALKWATSRNIIATLTGEVAIGDNKVLLRLGVTPNFPSQLPYVQLIADEDNLSDRPTAHVGHDGDICYTPTRDQAFDPERPLEVLSEALTLAIRTLETSWAATDNHEILDEFPLYWLAPASKNVKGGTITSYFTPDGTCRLLATWRDSDVLVIARQGRKVLSRTPVHAPPAPYHSVGELNDQFGPSQYDQLNKKLGKPSTTAIYIPLEATDLIMPPPYRQHWSAAELRETIRQSISPENLAILDDLLLSRTSTHDLLVLGIPRPKRPLEHRYGLVAVQLRRMRQGHLLALNSKLELREVQVAPLHVGRRDAGLIMRRGGSQETLLKKRVLLLGCGSLGGHLAFMLCSSGVGDLTLVDPDHFMTGNTYRHALGRRFLGKPKVEGMEQALLEKYPYLKLSKFNTRTESAMRRGLFDLRKFDLVIDATGDTTHQLTLSGALRAVAEAERPSALFLWLDPLGLGGHHLTVLPGEPGCPRCLYSAPASPMANAASFSAPYQNLGHDDLGCGTYHTPYSDLDAIRTAEESTRTAIRMLQGEQRDNRLYSWKGEATAFLAAGHQLSERHRVKRGELRRGTTYANSDCPECRGLS